MMVVCHDMYMIVLCRCNIWVSPIYPLILPL